MQQKQKMYEDELERLRLQLATYNEEEKRVMQELEETRSLRRAFHGTNPSANGGDSQSSVGSSFQLLP